MRLFKLLIRSNARSVTLAVIVSVISGVANPGLIALIHRVWNTGDFQSIPWALGFLGVLAVLITTGIMSQMLVLELALKAIADLRRGLSEQILRSPLSRLENMGTHRLLAVLTDDVSAVSRTLPLVPRVVMDGTALLAGVVWMAWLSWQALLILLAFIAVGMLIYKVLNASSRRFIAAGREVLDVLMDHFRALQDGIKQLKLNARRRQSFLNDELQGALDDYKQLNMSGRKRLVYAENLTRMLFFVLLGMLIFAVPRIPGIDRSILSGYVLMALFLYRPLSSLMILVPEFTKAKVSLTKIEALGLSLADIEPDSRDAQVREETSWSRLELRGVCYSYGHGSDEREFSVGPFDLSFQPGELVFVVGGNGSGKTTLAKLITSLYLPSKGEILLDGKPVTAANLEQYRQLFSVVFADFHLFGRLLSSALDTDAVAAEHLQRLELTHKVQVEDSKLSTTALSQGQRKRLALLTAYLEDRPFYVFDEWAADQDPHFKKIFYTQLLPEMKERGRTIVVITHDDRYLYVADRCIKLEDGRLLPEAVMESTGGSANEP